MWSLTLKEAHKLQGYENKVLRKTFEPKKDEVSAIGYHVTNFVIYMGHLVLLG